MGCTVPDRMRRTPCRKPVTSNFDSTVSTDRACVSVSGLQLPMREKTVDAYPCWTALRMRSPRAIGSSAASPTLRVAQNTPWPRCRSSCRTCSTQSTPTAQRAAWPLWTSRCRGFRDAQANHPNLRRRPRKRDRLLETKRCRRTQAPRSASPRRAASTRRTPLGDRETVAVGEHGPGRGIAVEANRWPSRMFSIRPRGAARKKSTSSKRSAVRK